VTALQLDVRTENDMHRCESGQLGRLVDYLGPFHPLIDLLKSRHVGMNLTNHTCDSFDIQGAVDAFGMMNVVAEQTQPNRFASIDHRRRQHGKQD